MGQGASAALQDTPVARNVSPRTVTRQSLYDEIWQTSMPAVADQLGITVRRLEKICVRFDIPVPGPSESHRSRPPLAAMPASETLTISSASARLRPGETTAGQTHKVEPECPGPYHPQLNAWVSGYLAWCARFNLNAPSQTTPQIPSDAQKALNILDLIFRAAQKKGLVPELTETNWLRNFQILYDGAPVHCELRATMAWVTVRKYGQEYRERQHTGHLLFRIMNFKRRELPQTEWREKIIGPLENHIGEIVDTIVLAGPLAVQAQTAQREREREAEIARMNARERERDRVQRESLARAAADHQTACNIRALIDALEKAEYDPTAIVDNKTIAEWLTWAKAQPSVIDPVCQGADALFQKIASTGQR